MMYGSVVDYIRFGIWHRRRSHHRRSRRRHRHCIYHRRIRLL